jgi:hypothetical protein
LITFILFPLKNKNSFNICFELLNTLVLIFLILLVFTNSIFTNNILLSLKNDYQIYCNAFIYYNIYIQIIHTRLIHFTIIFYPNIDKSKLQKCRKILTIYDFYFSTTVVLKLLKLRDTSTI